MTELTPTKRSQLKRVKKRGHYDREIVYQILDEAKVCHVGFTVEGQPYVIPTAYGRIEDKLYVHGSKVSRMMKTLQTGVDVCITVTLLDGLVLARSAFHHSMNYRSVVIFGKASLVVAEEAKIAALRAFTEHIVPGRWDKIRPPKPQELAATTVLSIPIVEASAKIRSGPPKDDEADLNIPVWAGVIPLKITEGEPIADR
ncbi:MAG: pyridoxamine 5'-phosphate oxidase family protein [Prochloraceae cyanobacterium]